MISTAYSNLAGQQSAALARQQCRLFRSLFDGAGLSVRTEAPERVLIRPARFSRQICLYECACHRVHYDVSPTPRPTCEPVE
jgi:hypothetical protein